MLGGEGVQPCTYKFKDAGHYLQVPEYGVEVYYYYRNFPFLCPSPRRFLLPKQPGAYLEQGNMSGAIKEPRWSDPRVIPE